jgi:hypothetical protein
VDNSRLLGKTTSVIPQPDPDITGIVLTKKKTIYPSPKLTKNSPQGPDKDISNN